MSATFFHGWLYRTCVDPRLVPVRELVGKWVPDGASVVDVGCGTGAQLFALSHKIVRGLGVDLSRAQVNHARKRAARFNHSHIEFQEADATRLDVIRDREFAIGVTSMVIHEMPIELRLPVLNELRRISTELIVVDWAVPQPKAWLRVGAHAIERIAGGEHYRGFCSFNQNGGMPALIEQVGLSVIDEQDTAKGSIHLWLCA